MFKNVKLVFHIDFIFNIVKSFFSIRLNFFYLLNFDLKKDLQNLDFIALTLNLWPWPWIYVYAKSFTPSDPRFAQLSNPFHLALQPLLAERNLRVRGRY